MELIPILVVILIAGLAFYGWKLLPIPQPFLNLGLFVIIAATILYLIRFIQ